MIPLRFRLLRASALAAAALALFSLTPAHLAFADGRDDWNDYAWQTIGVAACTATGSLLQCPLYHQKWDWKRNQWVDMAVALDLSTGRLRLTQRLTNNDPHDDDHVCVTALAVDAAGRDVIAHHQNWYMNPGETREESFTYTAARLASVTAIHIGSKQCRKGGHEDDALYARVRAGIGS